MKGSISKEIFILYIQYFCPIQVLSKLSSLTLDSLFNKSRQNFFNDFFMPNHAFSVNFIPNWCTVNLLKQPLQDDNLSKATNSESAQAISHTIVTV